MKGKLSRAIPSHRLHVVLAITTLIAPAMEPFMRGVTLDFSRPPTVLTAVRPGSAMLYAST